MAILQQYSDLLLRGRVSVGYSYFTGQAKIDIAPGTASLAPIRVAPGILLSSTVSGAVENDGAKLYWTDSNGVRSSLLTDKNYYQFGMSVLQASRLTTGRYIGLGGGVVAESASFNGEGDVILRVSSVCADYLTGLVPIGVLPVGGGSGEVAAGDHTHSNYSLTTHDHDSTYLKLSGGTLTGGLTINDGLVATGAVSVYSDISVNAGNSNRYVLFLSTTTHNWRVGYEGSGSGESNYLSFESTKATADTWTKALFFEAVSHNATFSGNILSASGNTIGDPVSPWANIYATTFTGALTGDVTGSVTGDCSGSSGSCTGNAATASKLGLSNVGGTSTPIYLLAGEPKPLSSAVGSAFSPVYLDSGEIKACGGLLGVSITGNADNATNALQASRLTTGRYIGLGGGVVAESASFNGEGDVILHVSSVCADYLVGGTMTGNLSSTGTFTSDLGFILNVGDSDRYLTFNYTVSAGYSWRIGYLGSGAGEANYLTIESSQTSGAFTRAVQYGLISLDATHYGNILPATGVSKSLGSSTQKWSSVYASSFSGAYLVNNFGGSWIHGKTAEDCVLGNVQQSTSNYHVMMRVTSASGNVWNVGGINDTIGFYGYYAATTENRTDWATVWNTSTGALTHNKALTVSGATVLSSTLSVSSTVTFTSLSTAGVVHNSAAGVLSTGKVALGSEVSGILGVGNGGTGATTFTANGVLYGNGTGAVQATPAATVAGQFLVAGSDLKPVFSTVSVASGDHNHDATYLKLDGSSYMNGMLGYHVGNSYSFTNDGSYFEVLSIGPITGFVKIKASNPSTQANMIIRIDYYSYELKGYYVIAGLMYGPTKSWLSGSVLFKSNNLLPNVRLTYSVSQGHCVLLGNSSTVLNSQTNSSTPFIITVRHCHGAMFSAAPNWVITRESTEETWLYDQVYSTYNTGLSSDLLDGQHGSYYLNASNLNAGTVPFARLPTGTASDKVATGNHNHDTVYYRYVKNFTTNEDINTAGELGFYKNPGVTSVGIPTGASSYGTLLNLALPSYYGVQFYVTDGRIVYCRISNTVGGFSDWSTMWSSVNSNSTSYDWSAKNLTLAGTISGATTVTATTFSGSGASLTNLPAVSLTGQVSVANGGTGRASLTANYLLYGDGVNSVGMLAIGGANTFLKSTGSGYEWASIRKNDSSEITTLSTTKATPTAITYASGDNKVYHLQCMASSADQVFYVNLPDLANVVSGDKLEFTLTKTSGTYDAQVVFNPNTSSDIFRLGSSTTIAGTTERVRIGTGEAIVFYALYSGQAGLSWRVMRYVDMEV